MLKYFIIIISLFQIKIVAGQQKSIIIEDSEGNPIEDVWILILPDSASYFTDSDGIATVNEAEYLQLYKLGYFTKRIEFNSIKENNIIKLEIDDIILNEVIVGSNLNKRKLKKNPGNIDYLSKLSIQQSNPTIITDRLNQIPGIFMQSGALNTNRITIRGIGSRSPFSTNKIRAYYKDIPLTNGTGETTIEDIDLEAIGSMEVIKGPNSSKYGSGLGGVILIKPYNGNNLSNSISLNTTLGSFGQIKNGINLNLNKNNVVSTNLSINRLSSEGYRENNKVDRMNIQLTNEIKLKKDKISLIGYYVDQKAFIPSSLGITDFSTNPEKAANNWAEAQGFEDYYTLHLGLGWDHIISDKSIVTTSIYTSLFNNYEARPFNILSENTNAIGVRSRFIYDISSNHTILFGVEAYQDKRDWRTFENLYEENNGNGSLQGNQLVSIEERRSFVNLFSEWNWKLSEKLNLETGININQTSYLLDDNDTIQNDVSGSYAYPLQLSPKVGINYQLNSSTNLFASASNGFSPPSLEETLTPNGNLNDEIQPETGWMEEVGIRLFYRNLTFTTTLYSMQIQNLLVSRRIGEDQFIGLNAGSTLHNGIESSLFGRVNLTENSVFEYNANYAYQHYTFTDFIDGENDYSGNQLTGVPSNILSGGFRLNFFGFYLGTKGFFADKMPITDDNIAYNDSYFLIDALAGYQKQFNKLTISIDTWLQNLTDKNYASMVQVNASAFGSNEPRYYYPGLPRNLLTRIAINYSF